MPRLTALDPKNAPPASAELLDGVNKKLGRVPNIMATMAQSPAVLKAYLEFSGALADGALPAGLREKLALVVGEKNGCNYCVSAHRAIGGSIGVSEDELDEARQGRASDPKEQAALTFALRILETRGFVTDEEFGEVRDAGYTDAEIAEIVAAVALNLFTNTFNHVAETEVDFPAAPELVSG